MTYKMMHKRLMVLKRKAIKERKVRKIQKGTKMITKIKIIKDITIIYVRKLKTFRCKNKMKLLTKSKGWVLYMTKKCFYIKIMSQDILRDQKEFSQFISI